LGLRRLTAERRSRTLADLKVREAFTMKALARHGVSNATLWRQQELRDASSRHVNSDKQDIAR
jgi:hypothetical protein